MALDKSILKVKNNSLILPAILAGFLLFFSGQGIAQTSEIRSICTQQTVKSICTYSSQYQETTEGTDTSSPPVATVNQIPSALDSTINTNQDTPYTFKQTDFGYSDSADNPPDPMASIKIISLPANGTLELSGTVLDSSTIIITSDIPNLIYRPNTNYNGTDSYSFSVNDGYDDSSNIASLNINVAASPLPATTNNPPVAQDRSITVDQNATYNFDSSDFSFTDVESDNLVSITIQTTPSIGSLTIDNNLINAGDTISSNYISDIKYISPTAGADSFTFTANDSSNNGTSQATITIAVNTVVTSVKSICTKAVTVAGICTYNTTVATGSRSICTKQSVKPSICSYTVAIKPNNVCVFINLPKTICTKNTSAFSICSYDATPVTKANVNVNSICTKAATTSSICSYSANITIPTQPSICTKATSTPSICSYSASITISTEASICTIATTTPSICSYSANITTPTEASICTKATTTPSICSYAANLTTPTDISICTNATSIPSICSYSANLTTPTEASICTKAITTPSICSYSANLTIPTEASICTKATSTPSICSYNVATKLYNVCVFRGLPRTVCTKGLATNSICSYNTTTVTAPVQVSICTNNPATNSICSYNTTTVTEPVPVEVSICTRSTATQSICTYSSTLNISPMVTSTSICVTEPALTSICAYDATPITGGVAPLVSICTQSNSTISICSRITPSVLTPPALPPVTPVTPPVTTVTPVTPTITLPTIPPELPPVTPPSIIWEQSTPTTVNVITSVPDLPSMQLESAGTRKSIDINDNPIVPGIGVPGLGIPAAEAVTEKTCTIICITDYARDICVTRDTSVATCTIPRLESYTCKPNLEPVVCSKIHEPLVCKPKLVIRDEQGQCQLSSALMKPISTVLQHNDTNKRLVSHITNYNDQACTNHNNHINICRIKSKPLKISKAKIQQGLYCGNISSDKICTSTITAFKYRLKDARSKKHIRPIEDLATSRKIQSKPEFKHYIMLYIAQEENVISRNDIESKDLSSSQKVQNYLTHQINARAPPIV